MALKPCPRCRALVDDAALVCPECRAAMVPLGPYKQRLQVRLAASAVFVVLLVLFWILFVG